MAAGVATKLWEISDVVALIEASEAAQPKLRGFPTGAGIEPA
jgi:hypothetical protein